MKMKNRPQEGKNSAQEAQERGGGPVAADYSERARTAAEFYAAGGMRVFPCRVRSKEPATPHGFYDGTTDPAQIAKWWAPGSAFNVAIATGGGVVVLDVDIDHDRGKYGDETLAALEQEHGALPETWTCLTGGGGVHYYFRCDDPRLSAGAGIAPGLDYRAGGGYVVAPPSIHPGGGSYEWEASSTPSSAPLAPLPEWLHELMLKGKATGAKKERQNVVNDIPEPIPNGDRGNKLFYWASKMRGAGLTRSEIYAALHVLNAERCDPPAEEYRVKSACDSVAKRYPRGNLFEPFFSLQEPPAPQDLAAQPGDYGPGAVDAFLEAVQGERYKPIPTGFSAVDEALGGGVMRQTLIVLGAAPGMGKTALAAQIGESLAKTGAADVLYINLEMSREQLLARSLSRIARKQGVDIPHSKVLRGYAWTAPEREAIERAAAEYKETIAPRMVYNPGAATADLEAIMWKIQAEQQRLGRAPAVVLDYLQLLTSRSERREEDAATTIKRAVQRLKEYAIRENTVVLVITANNRASNKSGESGLTSGRDTSNIEYGADVHLGIEYEALDPLDDKEKVSMKEIESIKKRRSRFPDDPTIQSDYEKYCTRFVLRINKNRMGEAGGGALLDFDGAHSLFLAVDSRHKEPFQVFRPTKRL